MKKIFVVLCLVMFSFCLTGCGVEEDLLGISYNQEGNTTSLDQYDTENPVVAMSQV